MKELPTYAECVAKVGRNETLSAVELFIYGNEPESKEEEDFRKLLLAALEEAMEKGYNDGFDDGLHLA